MDPRLRTTAVPRTRLPRPITSLLLTGALCSGAALGLGGIAAASTGRTKAHAAAPLVKTAKVAKLGTVLVTAAGFALYRFTPDKANKVACTGTCASIWPPLYLPAGMHTPTGPAGLGTVKDPDGKLQVTYRGHPLYTYVGDKKPDVASGQGHAGKWFAVTTSVAPLAMATASTPTSSTGSSSGSSTSWS